MRNFLTVNEHPAERVARVTVGVALVAMPVTGTLGWWGCIGVGPILTGLVGSCPIYTLAGISTCPIREAKS